MEPQNIFRRPTKNVSQNKSNAQDATKRQSVAAVIRPVRHLDVPGDSVRLDEPQAQSMGSPHVRINSLDDYVKNLREQVAPQSHISQNSPVNLPNRSETIPGFPGQRLDGAHQQVESSHISADQFQTTEETAKTVVRQDMDELLRALELKLETLAEAKTTGSQNLSSSLPGVILPESLNDISESESAKESATESVAPILDTNEIIRSVSRAIASVITDQSQSQIEQRIRMQLKDDLTAKNVDENLVGDAPLPETSFVDDPTGIPAPKHQTGNQSKVGVNSNLRNQIVAAYASIPAAGQMSETDSNPSLATTPSVTSQPVTSQPVTSQPETSQNQRPNSAPIAALKTAPATPHQMSSEIPTNVAAWDVEDFRWPRITNSMIVQGSAAISELAKSIFQMKDQSCLRLGITSSGRGEGSTSIGISLARWAAATGRRVLLVDADLASPGLSSQVGLGPGISWVNAISTSLDPAEVIIRSQKSELCVMPMAPIETRVSWPRFIYDQLGTLTDRVQNNFDLILFDVGPVSQLTSELSRSDLMIDAALVVHSNSGTSSLLQTRNRLEAFGIRKYAVAKNSVSQQQGKVA